MDRNPFPYIGLEECLHNFKLLFHSELLGYFQKNQVPYKYNLSECVCVCVLTPKTTKEISS